MTKRTRKMLEEKYDFKYYSSKEILKTVFGIIIIIVVAILASFIMFNIGKRIASLKKELQKDYDYVCTIDFANSSDERLQVEQYTINDNSVFFELLDGTRVYMQLDDNVILCEKYLGED